MEGLKVILCKTATWNFSGFWKVWTTTSTFVFYLESDALFHRCVLSERVDKDGQTFAYQDNREIPSGKIKFVMSLSWLLKFSNILYQNFVSATNNFSCVYFQKRKKERTVVGIRIWTLDAGRNSLVTGMHQSTAPLGVEQ